MRETQIFVGVDVSKARLDVAMRPSGDTVTVCHDEAGIAGLVTRLQAWQPAAVVLEATGDLEAPLSVPCGRRLAGACRQSPPSPTLPVPRDCQDDTLDAQILPSSECCVPYRAPSVSHAPERRVDATRN